MYKKKYLKYKEKYLNLCKQIGGAEGEFQSADGQIFDGSTDSFISEINEINKDIDNNRSINKLVISIGDNKDNCYTHMGNVTKKIVHQISTLCHVLFSDMSQYEITYFLHNGKLNDKYDAIIKHMNSLNDGSVIIPEPISYLSSDAWSRNCMKKFYHLYELNFRLLILSRQNNYNFIYDENAIILIDVDKNIGKIIPKLKLTDIEINDDEKQYMKSFVKVINEIIKKNCEVHLINNWIYMTEVGQGSMNSYETYKIKDILENLKCQNFYFSSPNEANASSGSPTDDKILFPFVDDNLDIETFNNNGSFLNHIPWMVESIFKIDKENNNTEGAAAAAEERPQAKFNYWVNSLIFQNHYNKSSLIFNMEKNKYEYLSNVNNLDILKLFNFLLAKDSSKSVDEIIEDAKNKYMNKSIENFRSDFKKPKEADFEIPKIDNDLRLKAAKKALNKKI